MVTIGVYGCTAGAFLELLTRAGVGLLLDLRQRRGVRGPDYSWANSVRLQCALAAADTGYRHVKDLAPTTELRQLQYDEDARQGMGKRNRTVLAAEYAQSYELEILDRFDLGALVAALPDDSATALLCVERDAQACHRSLVAERLRAEHGLPVTDLRPAPATPSRGGGSANASKSVVSRSATAPGCGTGRTSAPVGSGSAAGPGSHPAGRTRNERR